MDISFRYITVGVHKLFCDYMKGVFVVAGRAEPVLGATSIRRPHSDSLASSTARSVARFQPSEYIVCALCHITFRLRFT